MTSPLQPRGITVPPEVLYCQRLPPAVRDTWLQLRALANGTAKVQFDGGVQQAASISGKSTQTVYGHLAVLRDLKALSFFSSGGVLFVTFDDKGFLEHLSKIFDASISLIKQTDSDNPVNLSKEEEQSKILDELPAGSSKNRDPLLQDPAVRLYRTVMHLTANHIQRKAIAGAIKGDNEQWHKCLVHWAGHGWSPTNVTGMLNSFENRSWETCGLCKRTSSRKNNPTQNQDFRKYTEGLYAEYIQNFPDDSGEEPDDPKGIST